MSLRFITITGTSGRRYTFSSVAHRHLSLHPGGVFANREPDGAITFPASAAAFDDPSSELFVHIPVDLHRDLAETTSVEDRTFAAPTVPDLERAA